MTLHEAEDRVIEAIRGLWPDYWTASVRRQDRLREECADLTHDGTDAGRIFLLYWELFSDFAIHDIREALIAIREHQIDTVEDLAVLFHELSEEYRTADLEAWNK